MIFEGKVIVNESRGGGKYNYQVVEDVMDFNKGDCIIIKSMNPDYSILLNKLDVIISEKGSVLSHLATIAREYDKTLLLVKGIINKIPKKGRLNISYEGENAKIQI